MWPVIVPVVSCPKAVHVLNNKNARRHGAIRDDMTTPYDYFFDVLCDADGFGCWMAMALAISFLPSA